MNWFKKLFGSEQKTTKVTSATGEKSKTIIEIPNSYGHYDSSPLLVEESPELEKIFSDPNPPVIQKLSDANREYWSTASASERCMTALIGYLQHPNPEVRRAVMGFIPQNQSGRVSQVLIDRLGGDPDSSVRIAAAKTIWECEREVNCKYAVDKLKDEMEYGTERSMVGPTRARKAVQLLIEYAPNQEAKDALKKLINQ
jgi:HEAT repeat protein